MIYACGSVVGNYDKLNSVIDGLVATQLINSRNRIHVVVCGDFGYDPDVHDYSTCINTHDGKVKVYFMCSETDNYAALKRLEDSEEFDFVMPIPDNKNIFYCFFGASKTLDGKRCLFCGGANAKDARYDPEDPDSCIAQTAISQEDMEWLPTLNYKPTVVFSHTSPSSVSYALADIKGKRAYDYDPSAKYLTEVYRKYNPKQWFFGHWNKYKGFRDFNTDFVSVADATNSDGDGYFMYRV